MIGAPEVRGKSASQQKQLDAESRALLYQGASISQLGILFGIDNRTVTSKIQGLEPVGMRAGFPVFKIAEAAAYIVKPIANVEEYIMKMDPEDLPPRLNQRLYAGLRERNRYLEEIGELWNTGDVLSHFSGAFKTLRMDLELLQDAVAEQTEFSARQREILVELVEASLSKMRASLTEQFKHTDRAAAAGGESQSGDPAGAQAIPPLADGRVQEDSTGPDEDDSFFTVHDREDIEEAL